MTPLQLGSVIPQSSVVNPCFVEQFVLGLVPYTVISGDGTIFSIVGTPYGSGMRIASQSSGVVAKLSRFASSIQARTYSFKFSIEATANDDAGIIFVQSAGSTIMQFNPRREGAFDALRRPNLILQGESIYLGAGGEITTSGAWFQLDLTIIAGAGNTTVVVTRLSDTVVVISQNMVSAHTTSLMDSLLFLADIPTSTTPDTYADIHICP